MGLFSRRAAKPEPVSVAGGAGAVGAAPGRGSAGGPGNEARVRALGEEMLAKARAHKSGVFSRQFYSDALMEWSMKDPNFKVQMFRFVDAFPTLRTTESAYEHLTDYLGQPGVTVPGAIAAALKVGSLAKGMAVKTIGGQIEGMAGKFIAGRDAAGALPKLDALWRDGIAFSVDLLGEACVSEAEADAYLAKYLDLVENLPGMVAGWKASERLERDHLGVVPRVNVSIKISSLSARVDAIDTEGSVRGLMTRIVPVLEAARKRGVFVNFDMEQSSLKDLTIELFQRCCEAVAFEGGLAMQAYLRSGDADAERMCAWAKRTGRAVTVRLVKGAYWDYETIHGEQMGWASKVWSVKRETDACFERMAERFLASTPRKAGEGGVKLALGSHNVRSIAAALECLERQGLPRSAIELQMLHGMADQLKHAAAEMGLRIREYVPVGEMIPGMAYLVRRLLENTSNESWLKAGFMDHADPAALLASPHGPGPGKPDLASIAAERHGLSDAPAGVGDGRAFVNEPMRDFSSRQTREAFAQAVRGATVPRVANDRTPEHASAAVGEAAAFFPEWRGTAAEERAGVLVRAAALMRQRRDGLAGVMIKEAGKTWREADADVCEAIDFCEFYAREAVGLFERRRLGRFIGELDEQWHQPRGVCAVVSPWNFPLAIACGMVTAALATGNTVVLKPAEQTPGIASILADVLFEAGLPRGALKFLPGVGETTGAALVRDPRVAVIAFTGSKAVGLDIIRAAGVTGEGQAHVKKVVCEMGGKNAIIVDESADLDEAVLGVRHSAFGFQGQKCSACSRVIVVDSGAGGSDGGAMAHFVERLVESTRALVVGDPAEPGTDVGPVIDAEAKAKILGFIGRAGARGVLGPGLAGEVPAGLEERTGRHFVAPHVFAGVGGAGVPEDDELAREEIFGPVLAVMRAASFDEALRMANASAYKLTGGVFTRKPANIERAKREFRVGNLYINRGITGALVGRQPFGGFGMSGVGSKAGGREYLLQFVEPRASCENTLRRGFAPEL
ncbi:MAG: bifunctional proline dehydrogenase/L-glutamate gamma-semialdehyde dehydrogenase [Phycisphaerales bacterium]|nr:bifunctional proline dehydrogenase/L-glutamate gamma-semialdehyde dehydrogenase [Phycisphaerales bacterium]